MARGRSGSRKAHRLAKEDTRAGFTRRDTAADVAETHDESNERNDGGDALPELVRDDELALVRAIRDGAKLTSRRGRCTLTAEDGTRTRVDGAIVDRLNDVCILYCAGRTEDGALRYLLGAMNSLLM